jgi:hypothetical protein
LVVGDKVYMLDIKDQSSADALDKLAGRQVKVKGEAVVTPSRFSQ